MKTCCYSQVHLGSPLDPLDTRFVFGVTSVPDVASNSLADSLTVLFNTVINLKSQVLKSCWSFKLFYTHGLMTDLVLFHQISTGSFLWELIYPMAKPSGSKDKDKDTESRPVHNPAGRYIVRLFYLNRWRKVLIDDRVYLLFAGFSAV